MALSVSSTASGSEVSVGSQKPPFDLREPGAMPLKVPPRGSGAMPTISAPVTVPLLLRQRKTALLRWSA